MVAEKTSCSDYGAASNSDRRIFEEKNPSRKRDKLLSVERRHLLPKNIGKKIEASWEWEGSYRGISL